MICKWHRFLHAAGRLLVGANRHLVRANRLFAGANRLGAALTISLAVMLAPTAVAEETVSAAAELQTMLDGMTSYSAVFTQTVYDDEGSTLQHSSGQAQLQRPGKMYWHSTEPFQSITVSNGASLWHYDVDLEQVTRSELSADVSVTPALILGGDSAALQDRFTISASGEKQRRFVLTPNESDGVFSSLEFHFDDSKVLVAMSIFDSLLQKTHIVFSNTAVNAELDQSLFVFNVPDGVDLIDNGG